MPEKKVKKPKRIKTTHYLDDRSVAAIQRFVHRYNASSASEAVRRAVCDFDKYYDRLVDLSGTRDNA